MTKQLFTLKLLSISFILLLFLQGCSGNGFHLRKNVELASQFSKVNIQGLTSEAEFKKTFTEALAEAGGDIVDNDKSAKSIISFSKFEEGRRIIAYTSERRAREYLLYLKIEYALRENNKTITKAEESQKWRINIDRSYLYDPDFALGKAEEEKKVKQALYDEAVRLILLRIKYSK